MKVKVSFSVPCTTPSINCNVPKCESQPSYCQPDCPQNRSQSPSWHPQCPPFLLLLHMSGHSTFFFCVRSWHRGRKSFVTRPSMNPVSYCNTVDHIVEYISVDLYLWTMRIVLLGHRSNNTHIRSISKYNTGRSQPEYHLLLICLRSEAK